MNYAKPVFVVPAITAALLTVTACGGSSSSGAASPSAIASTGGMSNTTPAMTVPTPAIGPAAMGPHNTADADFSTAMIYHHAQAIQMADLVLARTNTAQVRALATRIKVAQAPEIAAMSGWLKGWGVMVPDTSQPMAEGMSMSGMMSAADMGKLQSAAMGKADTLFLTLMPEHHSGAIAMATKELANGSNPETKKLAQSIITSQTAEITEMKTMRASIG